MVKKIEKEKQFFYQCEECGFHYLDENVAKQCEEWCRKYQSCNLEITKNATENR